MTLALAQRSCSVEDCEGRYRAIGLCDVHYWALRTARRRERRLTPPVAVWSPACMSSDEWEVWRTLNPRFLAEKRIAERPCRDCPAAWAAEMGAMGCCNGTPGSDR